jgi:hypothetical protein
MTMFDFTLVIMVWRRQRNNSLAAPQGKPAASCRSTRSRQAEAE